ncbi:MAG: hypothetical protein CMK71_02490 [Pseudomonadaceae bacterium]|nr:hypothetical protein [Pseudomonadaceae bacterium]
MAFLEERFPEDIDYGSGFSTAWNNKIIATVGDEYRSRIDPYPKTSLEVDFLRQRDNIIGRIIDLNSRAGGEFSGFRVKNYLDFSTKNYREAPTPFDQAMQPLTAGTYQMMRWYGNSADPLCSRRRLRKPVAGSGKVGVGGKEYPASLHAIDYTTGVVTLASNKTRSITAISNASSATLTVGSNAFVIGDSVVVTGVSGMTQINGLRALVTAKPSSTQITIAINTSAFGTYAGGGTVQTQPASGEQVTCGCYFDIPMRFTDDLSGAYTGPGVLRVSSIGLVELKNPT